VQKVSENPQPTVARTPCTLTISWTIVEPAFIDDSKAALANLFANSVVHTNDVGG